MQHGQHHVGDASNASRSLKIVAWLQGGYFFFELAIGLWIGSVAVLADAAHSLSTVGGVVIALVGARLASRSKSTPSQTFGLARAEIIGSLCNGALLFVMAAFVLSLGVYRIFSPIEPPSIPMLIVAAGAIVTETIAVKLLYQRQKESLNVRGAFIHVVQVFVGSIFIVIAALVIQFTGFVLIDPILAIIFSLTLFVMSWSVIRTSINILLERTPEELDLPKMIKAIRDLDGVVNVHHVHAWSLTSGKHLFSAHIKVEDYTRGESIQREVHQMLVERFGIYFATTQIETECTDIGRATDIDLAHSDS